MTVSGGPHQGQPVLRAGQALERARVALVLAHGRGATARDILTLAEELDRPACAYLAPQAAGNTWYPNSFLAPLPSNEPDLSSALQAIADALARVAAAGIPPERTVLVGFSQGACLTLEYVARHARGYGGVAGLSGGLIGPDDTPRDYAGSLAGTPILLGCSDVDPYIAASRVEDSAETLRRLGAAVTLRLYPGMGHTINEDERAWLRALLDALAAT
jgi:predicted esterase